ncbi:MAG: rRNA maturation RNase YbeY [Bacteroidota bacterium]
MGNISYHYEVENFEHIKEDLVSNWILLVISSHKGELGELTYVFLSDDDLLDMNKKYLDHDYYTDILTFPHNPDSSLISGDIFISIDRVKENALSFNESFLDELNRVMIHGVLHLLGFDDHGENEKEMRFKESEALNLRNF